MYSSSFLAAATKISSRGFGKFIAKEESINGYSGIGSNQFLILKAVEVQLVYVLIVETRVVYLVVHSMHP